MLCALLGVLCIFLEVIYIFVFVMFLVEMKKKFRMGGYSFCLIPIITPYPYI